jgi:hypothetical protein
MDDSQEGKKENKGKEETTRASLAYSYSKAVLNRRRRKKSSFVRISQ